MQDIEFKIISTLVDEALAKGYRLSVNDGEETTISKSDDRDDILQALGEVDEEHLIAYDAEDKRVGWFFLVYGNEPYYVVNDYTANPRTEELFAAIQPLIEFYEEMDLAA